jgi:hypothetical protein
MKKASRADKSPHVEGFTAKHINCLYLWCVTVR